MKLACLVPVLSLSSLILCSPNAFAQPKANDEYTLPLSIVRNSSTGVIDIKRLGMMPILTWSERNSIRLVARNVDPQLGKDALFKLEVNTLELILTYDAPSRTLWTLLQKEQLPQGANTLRVTFIDKGQKRQISSPTLAWMVN